MTRRNSHHQSSARIVDLDPSNSMDGGEEVTMDATGKGGTGEVDAREEWHRSDVGFRHPWPFLQPWALIP
jgi:hypothetical protein